MKKKLFSNNKFSKENVKKFFNKEGFYVVLFLCITTIATSAVYITRHTMDEGQLAKEEEGQEIVENIDDHEYYQEEDLQAEEEKQKTSADQKKEEESQAKQENDEEEQVVKQVNQIPKNDAITDEDISNATAVMSNNTQEDKEDSTKEESNESQADAQKILNTLANPVKESTITMDYSFQTTPVFSSTLNEFRSDHMGVDISATKGTEVKAAIDGKVVNVEKDAKLGTLITIDHESGVKTKYGNLDSNVSVTKNDQVKKGQVIGKAGNSAMFEVEDDPHVHFEVWNGKTPLDPKDYIDLKGKK